MFKDLLTSRILKMLTVFFQISIFTLSAYAEKTSVLVESLEPGLKVGDEVRLTSQDKTLSGKALFLGLGEKPNGRKTLALFLNTASEKLFYVPVSDLETKLEKAQALFDPYAQIGGTCTGYAVYDYLLQSNATNFVGNGKLKKQLSEEEGRTQLLASAINEYYLTASHGYSIAGVLNRYGKDFGFKCRNLNDRVTTPEQAKKAILSHLKNQLPVMIAFNIGPEMDKSPFGLQLLNSSEEVDDRLWLPRKIGQRKNGGHTVVAAYTFSFKDKDYLVMIDSDWTQPRIWDVDAVFTDRTDIKEMDFITCKEDSTK